MAAVSRHATQAEANVRAGRTRWRRFLGLLTPALLVVMLMVTGVLTGGLPVSIAAEGQQRIKIEIKDMSATGYGAFPRFFQTQDAAASTPSWSSASPMSAPAGYADPARSKPPSATTCYGSKPRADSSCGPMT